MNNAYKDGLFHYLKYGTSPFHVIRNTENLLENAGFKKIEFSEPWDLEAGARYYVTYHGSSLFAFSVGKAFQAGQGMRIVGAHVDSPCPRIKTKAEINDAGYQKLNVEMYGGAILNTWLDRPLSIAGRVALRSEDLFQPRVELIDLERPVLTIPNLAIHMNRDVNKGVELNKQVDMLPLAGMDGDKLEPEFLLDALAEKLQVDKNDILDYELSIYNTDEPESVGFHGEFVSAPRLDDMISCYAAVQALIQKERSEGINLIALFDHEEIGSRTKQGAASQLLALLTEKIYMNLGMERTQVIEAVAESMMLSVDVAHALHPNQMAKTDVTNKPVLNGGFCIKESSVQSYATDSRAIAVVQQICDRYGISYQKSVNRSDVAGGSTLGAIAGTILPMPIVDLGVPLLAMHSARELMGIKDQVALQELMNYFFSI